MIHDRDDNRAYGFNPVPSNIFFGGALEALKQQPYGGDYDSIRSFGGYDNHNSDGFPIDSRHPQITPFVHLEESYFVECFNFLAQKHKAYNEAKLKLYKSISEASSPIIVLESFSDYYVQAEAIYTKTLEFIKERMRTFLIEMEREINGTNSVIKNYKSKFEQIKFYKDDRDGFFYTVDNVPDLTALETFNASLFDDLFKSTVNDFSVDNIEKFLASVDLEQDYKRFRGALLNRDSLSENEFASQLYRIFRDNTTEKEALNIDADSIKEIAKVWFERSQKIKSMLQEEYRKIESAFKGVLDRISKVVKNNSGLTIGAFTSLLPGDVQFNTLNSKAIDTEGTPMAPDMMVQLDMYCKLKLDQFQKYTDLVCQAVMAKLDAIKQWIIQDATLLHHAVDVLQHPEQYYDALSNKYTIADYANPVNRILKGGADE